ncbi:iron-containing alcohol dehydrogenase [Devosia sp. RR2S18]|uniref:iron-containing alcohol dehydrogenase n=1 Tax=Devosia rhizosphaerae TaxID=3049774 RepID=UPI00254058BD|nr:iron-containing alcohol dehydrogenase [Devosia sp. RR2S18]WIJ25820.1 iron-containing alcohol dehydrogenase [Devosia sp. RR2S18]
MFGTLRSPRAVYFGAGQRKLLGELAARFGRRALICTDERLSADSMFQAMMADLVEHGVEPLLFDRTIPDLPVAAIEDAIAFARGKSPDCVIAIGGGSCLDMAKATALLLAHGGSPQDYYGEFKLPGPVLPIIAIPTTAGTGSEVTPVAVLSDPSRTLKVGISDPHLIPQIAICDPELTLSCPPGLTAVAGADALTHGIESFTAIRKQAGDKLALRQVFVGKNAISDGLAIEAIERIGRSLLPAIADGRDVEHRSNLMYGAMLAGQAFANAGNAAAHALQYPVGAVTHSAHGIGVAALMPYVMQFNLVAREAEYARIGRALGLAEGDEAAMARAAIDKVAELLTQAGMPATLAEIGFEADRIDWAAEQAMTAARLVKNNPVFLRLEDMQRILRAALHGDRATLAA